MFVIKWEGPGLRDYLEFVDFKSGATKWGSAKKAKFFETPEEAEKYLIDQRNNSRTWSRTAATVVYLHPLNA